MRKFLLVLLVIFFTLPAQAIQWYHIDSRSGRDAMLDLDSIKEYNNYYFYNIKVMNDYTKERIVITMQSKVNGGLSARIKYYKPAEYKELNGDYEHITDNFTTKLEPVEYGSIVSACYFYIKKMMVAKKVQIEL